jgi:hypothetical protein
MLTSGNYGSWAFRERHDTALRRLLLNLLQGGSFIAMKDILALDSEKIHYDYEVFRS